MFPSNLPSRPPLAGSTGLSTPPLSGILPFSFSLTRSVHTRPFFFFLTTSLSLPTPPLSLPLVSLPLFGLHLSLSPRLPFLSSTSVPLSLSQCDLPECERLDVVTRAMAIEPAEWDPHRPFRLLRVSALLGNGVYEAFKWLFREVSARSVRAWQGSRQESGGRRGRREEGSGGEGGNLDQSAMRVALSILVRSCREVPFIPFTQRGGCCTIRASASYYLSPRTG